MMTADEVRDSRSTSSCVAADLPATATVIVDRRSAGVSCPSSSRSSAAAGHQLTGADLAGAREQPSDVEWAQLGSNH